MYYSTVVICPNETMTWEEAHAYCASLGPCWRLPNIQELLGLVDYTKYNPTTSCDMLSAPYWSATEYKGDPTCAWGVFFLCGYSSYYPKHYKHYVRAVL